MKTSEFLSNFNSSANSPDEYYIWVSFMLAFLLTFYYTYPKKCRFKKKSNAQFLNFFVFRVATKKGQVLEFSYRSGYLILWVRFQFHETEKGKTNNSLVKLD